LLDRKVARPLRCMNPFSGAYFGLETVRVWFC
jgi:hypothetical protein